MTTQQRFACRVGTTMVLLGLAGCQGLWPFGNRRRNQCAPANVSCAPVESEALCCADSSPISGDPISLQPYSYESIAPDKLPAGGMMPPNAAMPPPSGTIWQAQKGLVIGPSITEVKKLPLARVVLRDPSRQTSTNR